MYLDHESRKIEPKEKRLPGTVKWWCWCRFIFNGLIWRKVSRRRWIFILIVIV
jgi:hypothetical protein